MHHLSTSSKKRTVEADGVVNDELSASKVVEDDAEAFRIAVDKNGTCAVL